MIELQYAAPIALEHKAELAEFALPLGFPFHVNTATGQVVEHALLYMCDRHLRADGGYVVNSSKARAEDLKDWLRYLEEFNLEWTAVEQYDVESYRDIMLDTISPHTHLPYSNATVRRRVRTVCDFYAWASEQGLAEVSVSLFDNVAIKRPAIDADMLAHVRGVRKRRHSPLVPKRSKRSRDAVRVLASSEVRSVFKHLGPLPSERISDDPKPSRDRLAAELAIQLGLRVAEFASLTVYQILALTFDENSVLGTVALRLQATKGSKPRTVPLPIALLKELLTYIDGEREKAIRRRKSRFPKQRPTANLFVNGTDAGANVGKPMTTKTAQRAFESAVISCGLVVRIDRTNPGTMQAYATLDANYSLHCLRHTFTVWTYYARKRTGDSEPWLFLADVLGHTDAQTTRKIYLRATDEFEAQMSDGFQQSLRAIRNA